MLELRDQQIEAITNLKNGNVLCGGVGSGKSRTALAYYYIQVCGGTVPINGKGKYTKMLFPRDLYIITTAKKRDLNDWQLEALPFQSAIENPVEMYVDSWNNIEKYKDVKNAFFIFDEQRVVGYGKWAKTFIEITKHNKWILLSATPGDEYCDYIPLFIANGFYKNKSDFLKQHVIFNRYSKFPQIERYINTDKLEKEKNMITIYMDVDRNTISHLEFVKCLYDKELYSYVSKNRKSCITNKPHKDAASVCRELRYIINTDKSRMDAIADIFKSYKKIIIFYNFDYELDILKEYCETNKIIFAEWNGHKHQDIPDTDTWWYLVQYTAGAEGWNCITTNVIIFYSQNYSYKIMAQASGRIDRMNTPFIDLYYFHLISDSSIDKAIRKALVKKKAFNEKRFIEIT